ncbi:MAG: hypothetical protein OCD02_05405 [Spirochaetaceae bacterium]
MNKLFKLLTVLAVMAFFTGCTLIIPEVTLYDSVTITNGTIYNITSLYVVPADEYEILTSYSTYNTYYSAVFTDVLGGYTLTPNSWVEIDYTDYPGTTDFVIVAFDFSDVYTIEIDTSISSDSINYPDDTLF